MMIGMGAIDTRIPIETIMMDGSNFTEPFDDWGILHTCRAITHGIIPGVHMKKSIVGGTVHFTFDPIIGSDGATIPVEPIVFDTMKCSTAVRDYAVPFAFMHRLGDAAALSRTLPDGSVRTITEAMRRVAIMELVTHYESGATDWNLKARASSAVTLNPMVYQKSIEWGISYEAAMVRISSEWLAAMSPPADSTPTE